MKEREGVQCRGEEMRREECRDRIAKIEEEDRLRKKSRGMETSFISVVIYHLVSLSAMGQQTLK